MGGDYCSDLPDLVWLRQPALSLKIDHIVNPRSHEYMMTAACPLLETKPLQQAAKLIKIDVPIGAPAQDPAQQLAVFCHPVFQLFVSVAQNVAAKRQTADGEAGRGLSA